jgi:hypothetical protein
MHFTANFRVMRFVAKTLLGVFSFVLLLYFCIPTIGSAETLRSNNFQFQETAVGGTGLLDSQSAHFKSTQQSGSIIGIDNSSSSTNFQIKAGNSTTNDPTLSFAITTPTVGFGAFSPAAAATATATFEVINYTSYGYVVQIVGSPPSYGSHTITAMSSTGPSQAGTEQFGVNLVANTSPVSLGANPDHGQFGFGSASSNYNTANNYRFVNGETIVSAPKSSGKTIYTISYIVNVSSLTRGGQYSGNQTLICTGTY